MNKPQYLYTLSDPRTQAIRYVGITTNTTTRLYRHCACAEANNDKNAWIQELKQAHLKPVMTVIETLPDRETALHKEKHWISYYLQQGCELFNKPNVIEDYFANYIGDTPLSRYTDTRIKSQSHKVVGSEAAK